MSASILNGKEVASHVRHLLASELEKYSLTPKLVTLMVGEDPASMTYVRNKMRAAKKIGIIPEEIKLPYNTSTEEVMAKVEELNSDKSVTAFIVQLPLPPHIDTNKVLNTISPLKDVDALTPENLGLLVQGIPRYIPCTPAGIIEIMKYYRVNPEGKNVVILGRSVIVGKPLALALLLKREYANAAVTVLHSRIPDLERYLKNADIVVVAIGKPHFLKPSMLSKGVIVIDVGTNVVEGKLVGDVSPEVYDVASYITPVPGGVGPMTVTMLLYNTVKAAKLQAEISD